MADLSDFTERELAVAALVGKQWTVKRIAAEFQISGSRVYALITAVAKKIDVPEGENDFACVAAWWRTIAPISLEATIDGVDSAARY